jgi:hypothetical protein
LENPANSELELWDLLGVKEIIERNPQWVIREIGRCAYGRREQKPTKIMTNKPKWVPKGRTGNGRCKAGVCTGWLVPSGETDTEVRLDTGGKQGGPCEKAQKAVKMP